MRAGLGSLVHKLYSVSDLGSLQNTGTFNTRPPSPRLPHCRMLSWVLSCMAAGATLLPPFYKALCPEVCLPWLLPGAGAVKLTASAHLVTARRGPQAAVEEHVPAGATAA